MVTPAEDADTAARIAMRDADAAMIAAGERAATAYRAGTLTATDLDTLADTLERRESARHAFLHVM